MAIRDKKTKVFCGGDHCSMLWNLPCSEDHGLPTHPKVESREHEHKFIRQKTTYSAICECGWQQINEINKPTETTDIASQIFEELDKIIVSGYPYKRFHPRKYNMLKKKYA